jgi:hypothetical protein
VLELAQWLISAVDYYMGVARNPRHSFGLFGNIEADGMACTASSQSHTRSVAMLAMGARYDPDRRADTNPCPQTLGASRKARR